MISKKYKQTSKPVERLHQAGFTLAKGIDERASVLSNDTVLHTVNLDIDLDGGAILRRPIKIKRTYNGIPTHIIRLDNECTVLAYCHNNADSVELVLEHTGESEVTFELEYTGASSGQNYYVSSGTVVTLSGVDFKNITFTNLNTAVLIYGARFTVVEADLYPICLRDAFDYTVLNTIDGSYLYRAIQMYRTGDTIRIRVVSPEQSYIHTADGELPLDVNLATDNPYALRDAYDQTVPSVKGLVLYAPTDCVNGRVEVSSEGYVTSSETTARNDFENTFLKSFLTPEQLEYFRQSLGKLDTFEMFPDINPNRFSIALSREQSSFSFSTLEAIRSGKVQFEACANISWHVGNSNLFDLTRETDGSYTLDTFIRLMNPNGKPLKPEENIRTNILGLKYTEICNLNHTLLLNLSNYDNSERKLDIAYFKSGVRLDSELPINYYSNGVETQFTELVEHYTEGAFVSERYSYNAPAVVGTYTLPKYARQTSSTPVHNMLLVLLGDASGIFSSSGYVSSSPTEYDPIPHIFKFYNGVIECKSSDQESYDDIFKQGYTYYDGSGSSTPSCMYYYFVRGAYEFHSQKCKVKNWMVIRISGSKSFLFELSQWLSLQGYTNVESNQQTFQIGE